DNLTQVKRKHDKQDEDPTTRSDHGQEKKRPQKDTKSLKNSSASKESSKDAEENIVDEMGNDKEKPYSEIALKTNNAPKNNWFKQPSRPPTLNPEWNKCQVVDDQPKQTWFTDLVSAQKDLNTFDELMATPIDFSNFKKNRLKLDKLTKEYL
nr:hypothetical protein [Tanacetum cinerariifolium]